MHLALRRYTASLTSPRDVCSSTAIVRWRRLGYWSLAAEVLSWRSLYFPSEVLLMGRFREHPITWLPEYLVIYSYCWFLQFILQITLFIEILRQGQRKIAYEAFLVLQDISKQNMKFLVERERDLEYRARIFKTPTEMNQTHRNNS